jgi:hypothetical protein
MTKEFNEAVQEIPPAITLCNSYAQSGKTDQAARALRHVIYALKTYRPDPDRLSRGFYENVVEADVTGFQLGASEIEEVLKRLIEAGYRASSRAERHPGGKREIVVSWTDSASADY